ncbi:hypothetical protein [Agaribacter flavus]|uniref:DUF4350 domain-containing protein n=1 Tax=Agaribacter flavus TaxID=1902781 RepID=A0ABV7FNW5_9ALTE
MKRISLKDSLVALLIVVFGAFLYANIETYEEEEYRGFGDEVYEQEYLALDKHLQNYGLRLVSSNNINQLFSDQDFSPNHQDIVIITQAEIALPDSLSSQIIAWVNSGGTLIIGLGTNYTESTFSTNTLMKKLGASAVFIDEQNYHAYDDVFTTIDSPTYGQMEIDLEQSIYIKLENNDTQNKYTRADYAIIDAFSAKQDADKAYPTYYKLALGDGTISILTDVFIWNNWQIDYADNVFLAHELMRNAGKVFVFTADDAQMWYQIIASYSPAFYWILSLLLLLILWFKATRFGAVRTDEQSISTSFSEHIRASGQFYWSNKQADKLLSEVRQQTIEAYHKRFSLANKSEEKIIKILSHSSALPEEKIHYYLFQAHALNEKKFIHLMQGLQQLRKIL